MGKIVMQSYQNSKQIIQSVKPDVDGSNLTKGAKFLVRGLGNIGKSLASPSNARRMRIGQLPASRRDIRIAHSANMENMKSPGLRGHRIDEI